MSAQPKTTTAAEQPLRPMGFSGVIKHESGEYHILKELGMGGMAAVYLVRRRDATGQDRIMALKALLPAYREAPEVRMLFEYEVLICRQLRHPNIVRTYELIRSGDDLFLVMEFIDGKNASQIVSKISGTDNLMCVESAVYIVAEVARALAYAHEKKNEETGESMELLHRDVSARNIMVSYTGEVKLLDFGIAKAKDRARLTKTGSYRGTKGYAAPEQVEGKAVDRRSDIYSLGVVLGSMLEITEAQGAGGRRPDDPGSAETVAQQMTTATLRSVQAIVKKATSIAPEDRFQTSDEMLKDLEKILEAGGGAAAARHKLVALLRQNFGESTPIELLTPVSSVEPAPPSPDAEPGSETISSLNYTRLNRRMHRRDGKSGAWIVKLLGTLAFLTILSVVGLGYIAQGGFRWTPDLPKKIEYLMTHPEEIAARILEPGGVTPAQEDHDDDEPQPAPRYWKPNSGKAKSPR